MSATTGPILAAAGIVLFNQIIVNEQTPRSQTPVIVGGFIAAGGFALAERVAPRASVALAWLAVIATLIVRATPTTPAPIENFFTWYEGK